MRWVNIRHPRTGGRTRISASALPYHLRAGWTVEPEAEPVAPPEPLAVADAAGTDTGGISTPETGDDTPPVAPPRTSRRPAGNDESGSE